MKQPKKLTREQKMRISSKGLECEQLRLVKEDDTHFTLWHLKEEIFYIVSKSKKGGYTTTETL